MERRETIITGGEIGVGRGITLALAEDTSMLSSGRGW